MRLTKSDSIEHSAVFHSFEETRQSQQHAPTKNAVRSYGKKRRAIIGVRLTTGAPLTGPTRFLGSADYAPAR